MSDSQAYLQESPEATRTPAIWSDCPIVALVWLVCLALSIHALREEVNTIIDFMMVSSPLERHKALYILTNERQHQTQCGKIKAVAHEATNSRIWQGRTSWQGAYQQHEDEISKNKTKRTQELKTCTSQIQRVSRDPTSRPKGDLAGSPQDAPRVRVSRVKKDIDVWPTVGRTSQQPRARWNVARDRQGCN